MPVPLSFYPKYKKGLKKACTQADTLFREPKVPREFALVGLWGREATLSPKGLGGAGRGKKKLDKMALGCVFRYGETEFPTLSRRNADYQLAVFMGGGRMNQSC